jgi:hypothetical protein
MISADILAKLRARNPRMAAAAERRAQEIEAGPPARAPERRWIELEPGVKTRVLPECVHRGEVSDTRDVPCCHGKVKREELFACALAEAAIGGRAWGAVCVGCRFAAATTVRQPGTGENPTALAQEVIPTEARWNGRGVSS